MSVSCWRHKGDGEPMFHAIIRNKLRNAFASLSSGDFEPPLRDLSRTFVHTFPGEHALGGTRHTAEGMRLWFERLFRLFPNLNFEIHDIIVEGWPWNVVAAVHWTDRAAPEDGEPYINSGAHILRIKWGKLDSQKVVDVCNRLAAKGITEASATPITEDVNQHL